MAGPGEDGGAGGRADPLSRWAGGAGVLLLAAAAAAAVLPLPPGSRGLDYLPGIAVPCLLLAAAGLLVPAIRSRPALLAGFLSTAAAVAMVAFHLRADGPGPWEGDASFFYRMAAEWPWRPDGWWRYRILVPAAVHHAPLSPNHAYALVAVVALAASGPLLSLLLRDLGYGVPARHAGVLLHLASFAFLYNSWNYAMPDPAAFAVLLAAARALARRREGEFAGWLLVGCVTKEVVLFLVPVRWLLRRAEEGDRRALLRTALVAAPAGLAFLLLRTLPGEAAIYTGFVTGPAFLFPWFHQPDNLARCYSPFAAGWGLVVLAALRPSPWARAGAAFALLAGASLLVTDAGRMLVYLAPFAVPMMLDASGFGPGEEGWPRASGIAAVALAAISSRLWEPFLLPWAIPVDARRAAALLLLPAVVALALRARRGGGGGGAPAGA